MCTFNVTLTVSHLAHGLPHIKIKVQAGTREKKHLGIGLWAVCVNFFVIVAGQSPGSLVSTHGRTASSRTPRTIRRQAHRTVTERDLSNSSQPVSLRVLATTDLHMNLLGHDYYCDRTNPGIGLSRTASLISQARSEAVSMGAATLLLDNGDGLQGTPLGEQPDAAPQHPLMRAFQVLDYDAIGLGNHDFNYGIEALSRTLQTAPCPVICSNMTAVDDTTQLPFVSSAILERNIPDAPKAPPIKIGLLSVLPVQTLRWDAHLLEGRVQIADMVQAARQTATTLRAEGCDLVIALAHTGLGHNTGPGCENALRPLALVDEIDALVGGHTHLLLPDPETVFTKPVVMPGAFGSHLGVIDLQMQHGPGGWRLAGWDCALRAIAQRDSGGRLTPLVDEDPVLTTALAKDHIATRARMDQPVGHSPQALHSYFTFFAPDQALALVANAQAAALRPLLSDRAEADLPLLSAASPNKYGARSGPDYYTDVAAGPLCRRHVADLHVFPNELRAVVLSGAQVLDWLEMSAGLFNQVSPGTSDTALVNPDRAGHHFDVLHGLDYQIDVSAPPRFHASGQLADIQSHRIRNATWNGRPLDKTQQFVVAVNSYRVGGGGNFNMVQQARQISLPRRPIQLAIYDYLNSTPPAEPLAITTSPWQLASLPGTEVLAFTGPAARSHLSELDHLSLPPAEPTADGFLRLRLPL
ncbi:bifunctional metallophosphatase/5'-nucleotidase [Parasedimentitalea maritima]|uniref:Bifunctional metallophosphatase/5'-nucleotidase n=1 Tax=Parasedimentitalea maritima TaxID=2578117 RepID=A0ABY2V027_9RHOB|nr:bifunctional metallophosphatase/5'-nucleotidase [Zongyanglinia marina]